MPPTEISTRTTSSNPASGLGFWLPAVASAVILGLVAGIPYYSLPFFYDYFEQQPDLGGMGWSRRAILLGLPLGTLVTMLAAPLLAHRIRPRDGIVVGSVVCALSISALGLANGSLLLYYLCWLFYMAGWTFAGPMVHQILLSKWYEERLGEGLAIAFFGISFFGSLSVALLARPLAHALGYRQALVWVGATLFLAAPLAWLAMPAVAAEPARPQRLLWPSGMPRLFWLLLFGSSLTIGGVACINQHLKLILREQGLTNQTELDATYGWTVMLLLGCSATGRFFYAWAARRLSRSTVLNIAMFLMLLGIPQLYFVGPHFPPYLFAIFFGLGMSSDSLLMTILAADCFGSANLARPMAFLVPVNTVAQTWAPFAATFLWSSTGSYDIPIAVVIASVLGGRLLLSQVAESSAKTATAKSAL